MVSEAITLGTCLGIIYTEMYHSRTILYLCKGKKSGNINFLFAKEKKNSFGIFLSSFMAAYI